MASGLIAIIMAKWSKTSYRFTLTYLLIQVPLPLRPWKHYERKTANLTFSSR